MALAKSQAYRDAADAPATLRAYTADVANFEAWWQQARVHLHAGCPARRRRLPSPCGRHRPCLSRRGPDARYQAPGDLRDPSRHRAQAWNPSASGSRARCCGGKEAEPRYGTDLVGARDHALFLIGFAGAMRRSELVGLDVAHVVWTDDGLKLLIERFKTDTDGDGAGWRS